MVEQLWIEYHQRLYFVALKIVKNRDDAEEVVQNVFLIVVQKLSGFKGTSSVYTWLHRITVNAALDYRHSRERRRGQKLGFDIPAPLSHSEFNPRDLSDLGELLVPSQRGVFKSVIEDQESLEDTGKKLGLSLGSVKSRLHRARRTLQRHLA